jgi:hypothetical protein
MKHEYKEARTPREKGKKLSHLEVSKGEEGGHVVKHVYENDGMTYHKPTEHVFGADEGHEALAHIAKHAGIEAGDGDEYEEAD